MKTVLQKDSSNDCHIANQKRTRIATLQGPKRSSRDFDDPSSSASPSSSKAVMSLTASTIATACSCTLTGSEWVELGTGGCTSWIRQDEYFHTRSFCLPEASQLQPQAPSAAARTFIVAGILIVTLGKTFGVGTPSRTI